MLGQKERIFKTHLHLSLDDLVPAHNFYRQLDAKIDLNFVRDLVKPFYTPCGRPSIDPVVFFKLQLIMLFEDIRSERQLMEQVNVNLAFRWYIGYDLDEAVPDHSSLTKIRERYGLPVFRRFFEEILQMCFDAGLVWGKELYFDGTRVEANAAVSSYVSNFEYALTNHLNVLFPNAEPPTPPSRELDFAETWIESYKRAPQERKRDSYVSLSNTKTSLTDADATLLRTDSHLGYHTQYVVDGGKNRIILAALVTPANIQDNQPMLDLLRWLHFRWRLQPKIAVGDSKFGTTDNIVELFQEGVLPLTPRVDPTPRKNFYTQEMFRYDAEKDVYYCPQNQVLKKQGQYRENRSFIYQGKAKVCKACPVRQYCTTNKRARIVHRSFFQEELDRAATLRKTETYAKAMRKRQVWIEPMFAEGKQWHGLRRFRLRRLHRVNIEALLIASVQNIKRLLKPRFAWKNHPDPVVSAALTLPKSIFYLSQLRTIFIADYIPNLP
jgi:transposase